ncbi:response regulator [Cohnella soli]|uniref:Response regulator n=1 Tax=Cohnella soli TaxID=425005 RepID=A0ABW0HK50_9BACL
MKTILVDDDPVMHLIMRKMLAKFPALQVAGTFSDAASADAFLSEREDIELAFVDISMPGKDGMSFASGLERAGSKMQVVFVTSHKHFALEAFELSALDYLVKPVTQERLERTVHRALAGRSAVRSSGSGEATDTAVLRPEDTVRITTLGDFSIRTEAGRVKWISGKSAELFAYLLMHRGDRISRARLVAAIFGGMTQSNAEKYLNTAIYQLRKSLEPLGLREAVRSENDGYALELPHAVVDYQVFEEQAGELDAAERLQPSEADKFLKTERLYTGDLFGNKAYVWAIHETERLSKCYAEFVKSLAQSLLELRMLDAGSKLLFKLHERDPLDESVVSLLMEYRWRMGDKKGLTAQYTDYVRLLNKELGIRPSRELLMQYDTLVSRPQGDE